MLIARKHTTFVLVTGLVLVLALFAFGVSDTANAAEPPSEDGVTPVVEDGNLNCATLNADSSYPNVTSNFGFKIDANPSGGTYSFVNGTQNGDSTVLTGGAPSDPSNSAKITPTAFESGSGDTTKFDWMATIGIDAVIVKAQDSNVYVYVPEDNADGDLQAPELKAISHVEFCYDYELTASKTAKATYTRTYDWTIDKSVTPDSHNGFAGQAFSSDYDVVVDQTVVDSNFAVSGQITVNNPTPFTVSFSVADSVGGKSANVTCPTTTLAPGATTTCTYSAALDSKTNGTNTATITSNKSEVGGASASANYAFGDPTTTVGHPTINVTDSYKGNLGSASGDKTFKYSRPFSCSSNPSDYTDGIDSDTYPNTAKIVETNQSDDASVDVKCYAPLVSKDASTEWKKKYDWTITKTANPTTHTGFSGDGFTSNYDVAVDQTVTDYGFKAYGKISVSNPAGAPDSMTVNVADTVDGHTATVDCGGGSTSLTVAAGATGTCDYTVGLPDNTDRTNTAKVTFNGTNFSATAPVDFGDPIIEGHPTINVTDSYKGNLGSASGDKTFKYSRPFSCSSNPSDYTDGIDSDTYPNTAKIVETNQSDDASVSVNCRVPAKANVVKTTTEGPENIGQLPFTFKLYDPAGNLVETQTLNGAGTVTFNADLKTGGTWKIVETLPSGWVSSTPLECKFTVAYPDSAGQTFKCNFDNTEMSRVKLKKLTGVGATPPAVDPNMNWTFNIYSGPHLGDASGSGTAWLNSPLASDTTFGDADGVLEFEVGGQPINLDPNKIYTICEMSVPSGYTVEWRVDRNNDGLAETVVTPYNPNEKDQIPEDLGNRCFDFGKAVTDKLTPGSFLAFEVINTFPGGAPRTPGYWKNWNRCTGGGQAANADRNGGRAKGYTLLEDILSNPGITWDDILSDSFIVPINNCEQAVEILDQRVVNVNSKVGDGKKLASDGARTLAMHLLAAQFNQGNGACTNQNVKDVILAAEKLLDKLNFDGKKTTEYLTSKSADYAYALKLAQYLDAYNNSDCDFTTLPPKPTLQ